MLKVEERKFDKLLPFLSHPHEEKRADSLN